jgi:hypothetical protein
MNREERIIRVMKGGDGEGGVVKTFPSLFEEGVENISSIFRTALSNFCRGNI